MKTPHTVILFLILSISASSLCAQDTIPAVQSERLSLKFDLIPQASYRFISNHMQRVEQEIMGSVMETNIETTVHYLFKVEQNNGKEIKIKASYERLAVTMQMPQDTLSMDTDQDDLALQSQNINPLTALVNQPFYIFLDAQGKVSKLEGLTEGMIADDQASSGLQESLSGPHFLKEIEKAFYIFPKDSVGMGETWHFAQHQPLNHQINLNVEKSFTMEGLSEDLAWINIDHQITSSAATASLDEIHISGTQQGTIEVDRVTGLIVYSESIQALEGVIQTYGMDIPLKISSASTLKGEKL